MNSRENIIEKIEEIKKLFNEDKNILMESVEGVINIISGNNLLQKCSMTKKRGIPELSVFMKLFLMKYFKINSIASFVNKYDGKIINEGKDVFYRFMNNELFHWRLLLLLFNQQLQKALSKEKRVTSDGYKCLILDDSSTKKNGKCIEKVSKVYNHSTNKYELGYKNLTLAYYDGSSIYPVNFSLHRENKKNNYGFSRKEKKKMYSKKRDKDSFSMERIKELNSNKVKTGIRMVKDAIRRYPASYFLCDSWFFCKSIISMFYNKHKEKNKKKPDFVSMCKISTRVKFEEDDGNKVSTKELLSIAKKNAKRSRKANVYYYRIEMKYFGFNVCLFFIRFSKKGQWNLIVTSDLDKHVYEILKIYSKRWTIEVLFKESKQYLLINKCQSRDFDAQIAYITIAYIFYSYLSYIKSLYHYHSIFNLFEDTSDKIISTTIAMNIWKVIIELLKKLSERYKYIGVLLDELFENGFFSVLQELTPVLNL